MTNALWYCYCTFLHAHPPCSYAISSLLCQSDWTALLFNYHPPSDITGLVSCVFLGRDWYRRKPLTLWWTTLSANQAAAGMFSCSSLSLEHTRGLNGHGTSFQIDRGKTRHGEEFHGKCVLVELLVVQPARACVIQKRKPHLSKSHCLNLSVFPQSAVNKSLYQWQAAWVWAIVPPANGQSKSLNININFPFLRRAQAV